MENLLQPGGDQKSEDDASETEKVDIGIFKVYQNDIKEFLKAGMYVYFIKVQLNKDIKEKNKTPYDFINNMESTGKYVDAVIDIENVGGLSDCIDNDLAFVFLFATILEPDLVPVALDIDADAVTLVDMDEFNKQNDVTSQADVQKKVEKDEKSEKKTDVKEKDKTVSKVSEKTVGKEKQAKVKSVQHVQAEEKVRIGVNMLNNLLNLAGELVLGRNQLMRIAQPLSKEVPGLNQIVQHVNHITTEMQEKIMQMRMQPVSIVFSKFHRVVRDLSKKLNKDMKLEIYGEDVELDKTIIEALSDSLTHLIRNCADHAIELPDAREKAGKPRQGTIQLKAYHEAGQVHLEVIDDGAGIDGKHVADKAVEKGLIKPEQIETMSDREMVRLILKPGFSMAKQVSDVSGRGVGMDVVCTNIIQLGGIVDIQTEINCGTKMSLVLPLTLAIVSGLVIRAGDQAFVVPEANIEELVRIKPDEIDSRINVVHDARVLKLRETLLPLIDLKEVLGITMDDCSEKELQDSLEPIRVLITRHGSSRLGIIVDSLENIEEVVVKPLPRYMKKLKCYSGASIMGNGSISLILDVGGIVEKSQLHFTEEAVEGEDSALKETAEQGETQTLLLFDNNTEEQYALPLEQLVNVADGICNSLGYTNGINCFHEIFKEGAWEHLGFSLSDVDNIISDVKNSVNQAMEMLG